MDVTVIIPLYNAEKYIYETLDSVVNQSFKGSIEVIIINDGSTDNSVEYVKKYILNNSMKNINFRLLDDGKNLGPGTRRNQGINLATGKAIQFLDSDDFLMANTLELAYNELFQYEVNSFVHYDWAFYEDDSKKTVYSSPEPYDKFSVLREKGCEFLLRSGSYFTVHSLYKTSFLKNNQIYYGEGYIYEDFEFFVKRSLRAQRVPRISNILYKVRVHGNSITKTNSDTMEHYVSFKKAISASYDLFSDGYRNVETPYHFTRYVIGRSLIYAEKRIPNKRNIRKKFLKEVLEIVYNYNKKMYIPYGLSAYNNLIFNSNLIPNGDVKRLLKIHKMYKKGKINYFNSRSKKHQNKIKNREYKIKTLKNKLDNNYYTQPLIYNTRRAVHKYRRNKKIRYIRNIENQNIKNIILMIGFDYRYTGNSRYLFEFLKDKYSGESLKFVTDDMRVPSEHRITPRSQEFWEILGTCKILIAESWIPKAFKKREGQTWIQLWHGTPFKKLLFDSHESNLISLNPYHKVRMKYDIERWDLLLADTEVANNKFSSAFDISKQKIKKLGYPRNEYLIQNCRNDLLKREIKLKYNIPIDKKIILYAPTWRDYNYKKNINDIDLTYLLNGPKVLNRLGSEYIIINKSHNLEMSKNLSRDHRLIEAKDFMETQELLLISDIIITDYSSIIFDAIHINKPFYLFINDYHKYTVTRGVYKDMINDFSPIVCKNEEDLVRLIQNELLIDLPSKYYNLNLNQSSEKIANMIENLLK